MGLVSIIGGMDRKTRTGPKPGGIALRGDTYTVTYEKDGTQYKLFKVIFGRDGSYFVTSPYHPHQKAVVAKVTVNYALESAAVPYKEFIDSGSADDDGKRLKLSHHSDGLIQFSGEGIVSGLDSEGNVRGIGVRSWPLTDPVIGPAFAVVVRGVEEFKLTSKSTDQVCNFAQNELTFVPGASALSVEGYYFTPLWRRFVRRESDGTKTISIVHPCGAILKLKVLLAPDDCALPGFIGLEMYSVLVDEPEVGGDFMLSSSTGNLRRNEEGEVLADGLFCMYPDYDIPVHRSLNFLMRTTPPPQI